MGSPSKKETIINRLLIMEQLGRLNREGMAREKRLTATTATGVVIAVEIESQKNFVPIWIAC